MESKTLAYGILTILVVSGVLWGTYTIAWPAAKSFLGLGSDLMNPAETYLGVSAFQHFVNEYKACKINPQNDCLCPFTVFSLPKGSFIEIENINGLTSFNYYSGSTDQSFFFGKTKIKYGDFVEGCKPKKDVKGTQLGCVEGSNYVVKNNDILVARTTPGLIGNYFKDGKFDTSDYLKDNTVYIGLFDPSALSSKEQVKQVGAENYLTPMFVYTSVSLRGADGYNLQTIYKNSNNLYFVPTPYTALRFFDAVNPDKKSLSDLYANLKQCKKLENLDETMKTYKELVASIQACLSSNEKYLSPTVCDAIKVNVPEKYKIVLTSDSIALNYQENKLDSANVKLASYQETLKPSELSFKTAGLSLTGEKTLVLYYCPNNQVCVDTAEQTGPSQQQITQAIEQLKKKTGT